MAIDLGKLEKVENLREVWKNEASDFTKWLAKSENIKLLSNEMGFNIVVDEAEASVGRYSVDIRAHDEDSEKNIIIENQLEATNHDHLGKIIVYASGLDARIQIWVVKDVREEHKQAIDWLNEHSDENINIFLVKVELWKIDNSKVAPKFQIISSPNNWAKTMRKKTANKDMSNADIIHLNFWEEFKTFCEGNVKFSLTKPMPQHWYDISVGSSRCHISLTYNVKKHEIACELYINNDKDLYYSLEQNKNEINELISHSLRWMPLENRKASRIKNISKMDVAPDGENWVDAFAWLKENATKFMEVFPKFVKEHKES